MLGTSIDTTEIANGTILFADVAANGCAAGEIFEYSGAAWTCGTDDTGGGSANSFETHSTPSGTSPVASSATDTLTWAAGSGVTVTGDSSTDTITIGSTLGASIETGEILDGTILFADIGANGCSSGEPIEWSGAAWTCGTDDTGTDSQSLFETISTTSGTSPVADSATDTVSLAAGSGVTVTGDAGTDTVTFAAVLGTDITSSEIVDGTITADDLGTDSVDSDEIATGAVTTAEILNSTILFADIGSNGCSAGDNPYWSGAAWICDADGGAQNVFDTISTTSGTSPAADTTTDTLSLAAGSGVTVTGDSGTDTVTFAAVLGTDITSSEIVDGTITADDLGTDSVETGEILDGTILFADIGANGCSSGEPIEWSGAAWTCGTDDTGTDSQSLFETISTTSGTSPVADSATDTVSLAAGSGVTVTGD
ncbi:MAG: hypothetical protein GY679_00925, partial [Mycoplasma sp.]|nr:hypothetical protein [Mycoplasma sp.]